MPFYKILDHSLQLQIKVTANAKKNEIKKPSKGDEFLSIRITAQREKGKANKSLIKLLSDLLDIPKSSIEIIRGTTNNIKTLTIATDSPQVLLDKLS